MVEALSATWQSRLSIILSFTERGLDMRRHSKWLSSSKFSKLAQMATFKNSTFLTAENVSLTSKRCTLRSQTEKINIFETLGTISIVMKAGIPPVITSIISSLSGSNRSAGRVGIRNEQPVDEPYHVLVNGVVPASVKPAANMVSSVSGGDRKERIAIILQSHINAA